MGRRRIRLMQAMPNAPWIVGVNRSQERRAQVEEEFGIRTFATLAEAVAEANPQAAFLCTAPASHGPAVMECIAAGLNVFMEINLIGGWYAEAAKAAAERGVKLFISSTPVYRRETRYIADAVHGAPVNYIYHCGQYLPYWHPWEDYHDFFAAKKETNGCREILCVEMPWCAELRVVCRWREDRRRDWRNALGRVDRQKAICPHVFGAPGLFRVQRAGSRRPCRGTRRVYSAGGCDFHQVVSWML